MGKTNLIKAMAELDEDLVIEGVTEEMAAGVPALEILGKLQQGMAQVGKLYESGDYYLSELIMSAEVFSNAARLLDSAMTAGGEAKAIGTMVLGTVKDNIHDIGKNIVATSLNCNGYKVIDVGVDVPIAMFVAAVKEHKPQVVGLCCLLTTAFDMMRDTVATAKTADSTVKVIIGGGSVDESVAKYCSADGY